jgi:hypothetical protein
VAIRSKTTLAPALPILGRFEIGQITPLRLGVFLALAMLGARGIAFALSEVGLFSSGEGNAPTDLREVRIGIVLALVIGYAPAAYGWRVRSLRATLESLRPTFGERGRPLDEALAAAGRLPLRTRRRWTAIGLALALSAPFLVDREPTLYLLPGYWRPEAVLNWLQALLAGWLLACSFRSVWEDSQRLSHIADRLPRIDLLDDRAIAPFGRHALRVALLTVTVPSLFGLLASDFGFLAVIVLLAVTGIAVATTSFLLPVRGIRRRVVEEKQAELERVREAIRGEVGALRESPLAYEARIEAVREWPFDVPTLARLAAFVLLPIGSWLGGALVERIVSRLFD